jgi:hypothetical protein
MKFFIVLRIWLPRTIRAVGMGPIETTGAWNTDCLVDHNNQNNVSMLVGLKNLLPAEKAWYSHFKCMDFIPGVQMNTAVGTVFAWCDDTYAHSLNYCTSNYGCATNSNQVNNFDQSQHSLHYPKFKMNLFLSI